MVKKGNVLHELDEKLLKQELMTGKETRPIVIYFRTAWSTPCRTFDKVVHTLSKELTPNVLFFASDPEKQRSIAEQFEISEVPTLLLIQNGTVKSESVGVRSKEDLRDWIAKF